MRYMKPIRDDVGVPLELNTSVRLEADLVAQVDSLASSWTPPLSRSAMLRVLVREALAAREKTP